MVLPIETQAEAKELADKFLTKLGYVALQSDISAIDKGNTWGIEAKNIPVIIGETRVTIKFDIDKKTGRVGVWTIS